MTTRDRLQLTLLRHVLVDFISLDSPDALKLESQFDLAKPGSLGMCLYTYRVDRLDGVSAIELMQVRRHDVTDIVSNEFGEQSFSFTTPRWLFLDFASRLGVHLGAIANRRDLAGFRLIHPTALEIVDGDMPKPAWTDCLNDSLDHKS